MSVPDATLIASPERMERLLQSERDMHDTADLMRRLAGVLAVVDVRLDVPGAYRLVDAEDLYRARRDVAGWLLEHGSDRAPTVLGDGDRPAARQPSMLLRAWRWLWIGDR
jgi:hypothetical protein